jgi:hypothetical protein
MTLIGFLYEGIETGVTHTRIDIFNADCLTSGNLSACNEHGVQSADCYTSAVPKVPRAV